MHKQCYLVLFLNVAEVGQPNGRQGKGRVRIWPNWNALPVANFTVTAHPDSADVPGYSQPIYLAVEFKLLSPIPHNITSLLILKSRQKAY